MCMLSLKWQAFALAHTSTWIDELMLHVKSQMVAKLANHLDLTNKCVVKVESLKLGLGYNNIHKHNWSFLEPSCGDALRRLQLLF